MQKSLSFEGLKSRKMVQLLKFTETFFLTIFAVRLYQHFQFAFQNIKVETEKAKDIKFYGLNNKKMNKTLKFF